MVTREQKIAQLKDALQREQAKLRKEDTGQKIVVGGAILAAIENNPKAAGWVISVLENVERKADQKRIAPVIEALKKNQAAGKSEPSEAQDAPASAGFYANSDLV